MATDWIEYNKNRPPDVKRLSPFNKPCPFCGSRNIEVHNNTEIACMDCGLRARRIINKSTADMGELWDRRANDRNYG